MRPSELGLPSGLSQQPAAAAAKAKGKEPMVVLSPDELDRLVQQQQQGGSSVRDLVNGTTTDDDGAEDSEAEQEPHLWEELASALLGTVPFAFLFAGMCVDMPVLSRPDILSARAHLY